MSSTVAKILRRKRVANALRAAVTNSKLVVIKAPIGYGKTTAVKDLARHLDFRIYYTSIRHGPHNAGYAWELICEQLQQQGVSALRQTQAGDFLQNDVSLRQLLALFKEQFGNQPTLLVLDDYHNAETPELNKLVDSFAREDIPGFRMLLLSRNRPELPLEDLRLKGYAEIFGPELLVFSKKEAERLFSLHGVEDRQAAGAAWDFSEGWPAALRMCLQSFLTTGGVEPTNDMEKLITESCFSSYTEREQSLLLHLSVLGSFSPEEAVMLCQDASSPHMLRSLNDRSAFVAYVPQTNTYRLHSIFQAYLAKLLRENSLELCRKIDRGELYRRAGECFARRGDRLQAIRLWYQAGQERDMERILQSFETPDDGIFLTFDPAGIAAIMEAIPWAVRCRHPIGYIGFIRRYMLRADRAYAARLLDEAETYFMEHGGFSPDMRAQIQGEVCLTGAVKDFNNVRAMYANFERAYYHLKGRSKIVHDQISWAFNCPHTAFLYLRTSDVYKSLVKFINERWFYFHTVSGACAGGVDLFLAEYLLETGDTLNAYAPLSRATMAGTEVQQLVTLVATVFTKARLYLAQGQVEQAWAEIDAITPAVQKCGHPIREISLGLCRGYIASVLGKKDAVPDWLLTDIQPSQLSFDESDIFSYIVRGKVLVVGQDWHRLHVLAEKITLPVELLNISFGRIHLLVFKALAAMHSGNSSGALASFLEAVTIARADGIITTLAEYGRHLYPLQRLAHGMQPDDAYLGILGKQLKKYARLTHGDVMPLTLREQDIIERVVKGENNREIGEFLGISRGSVSNNLSRIYTKLGVKNRIEAIQVWTGYSKSSRP